MEKLNFVIELTRENRRELKSFFKSLLFKNYFNSITNFQFCNFERFRFYGFHNGRFDNFSKEFISDYVIPVVTIEYAKLLLNNTSFPKKC